MKRRVDAVLECLAADEQLVLMSHAFHLAKDDSRIQGPGVGPGGCAAGRSCARARAGPSRARPGKPAIPRTSCSTREPSPATSRGPSPSTRRARRLLRRRPEKTRQPSGKAPVIASAPWPQRSWRSTSRSDCAIERPPRPAVIEAFPRMNVAVLPAPLWDQGGGDQGAGHPHRGQRGAGRLAAWVRPNVTMTPGWRQRHGRHVRNAGLQAGAAGRSGIASATGTSSGGLRHSRPAIVQASARREGTPLTASGGRAISGRSTGKLCSPCAFPRQGGDTAGPDPCVTSFTSRPPVSAEGGQEVRTGRFTSASVLVLACPSRISAAGVTSSRPPRPPRS